MKTDPSSQDGPLKPSSKSQNRNPKQSIADWVGEELKRHIASGELAPGDRLPGERQLSDALNVSRVSVRSALQNLKAQGLLSSVQGGGTHVVAKDPSMDRPLLHLVESDPHALHDLASLIGQVAAFGAGRAARLVEEADLQDMRGVLQTMSASNRAPSLLSIDDLKFHALVARASQSGTFMHIMSVLQESLGAALTLQGSRNQPTPAEAQELLALNKALLKALGERDEPLAAQLAVEHAEVRRCILTRSIPIEEKTALSNRAAQ